MNDIVMAKASRLFPHDPSQRPFFLRFDTLGVVFYSTLSNAFVILFGGYCPRADPKPTPKPNEHDNQPPSIRRPWTRAMGHHSVYLFFFLNVLTFSRVFI